jgi:hypothetical protein
VLEAVRVEAAAKAPAASDPPSDAPGFGWKVVVSPKRLAVPSRGRSPGG